MAPLIPRKFSRISVHCEAVIVVQHRQYHSRIKASLYELSEGGCALTSPTPLRIGEECLIWAFHGGQRTLQTRGRVVWVKQFHDGAVQKTKIGFEFDRPLAELRRFNTKSLRL